MGTDAQHRATVRGGSDNGAGSVDLFADANNPPATDRRWPISPQEEVGHLRHYELMVILDPDLEERTIVPSLDTFLNVVRNGGGTVEKVDVWGRRRLAYEIDKKVEGIYAVVDLDAEPAVMKELDRQLNLNEAILRTKVLRPDLR
jgi:small subunit ribosomal protein S6